MTFNDLLSFTLGGLISGILAGFLGIGGGILLVPWLVQMGFEPVQAAATSSLAILITAATGSWQNWRMGYLQLSPILGLGIPAVLMALVGAAIANQLPDYLLLAAFGCLLLSNLYLVGLQQRAVAIAVQRPVSPPPPPSQRLLARIQTGGIAGLMAGLFGVGGGVIMVPLQILLLNTPIKNAIHTSLGVIVITAAAACVGHLLNHTVVFNAGLLLGLGGLVGVQISTRFLPRLSEKTIRRLFSALLCLLAFYVFSQAWNHFQN